MKNPFGIVRKCLQAHMGLFAIRDEEGHRLAEDLSEAEADFLVAAINNHEKLVEVCGKAREILADTIIPMGINKKVQEEIIPWFCLMRLLP